LRNRILEIVVFLMDYLRENGGPVGEVDDLSEQLTEMGYSDIEISSAYSWILEKMDRTPETCYSGFPANHASARVLTAEERGQLSPEAYGFLIKVRYLGLVDGEQLESILDRLALLGSAPVALDQVKLLASSILFRDGEDPRPLESADSDGRVTDFYH